MNLRSVVVTARRFIAIDATTALALAAKAFVAVVPLVLVLAAWAPAGARQQAGAALVEGMGLDGATAAVVRQLVARPPDASEPVTIVGLVLLVFSVLGFARSLQRTFEAAWELPRSGLRGYGPGLLGAAVFIGELGALIFLAEAVRSFSVNVVVVALVRPAVGALAWVAGAAAARQRPGAVARPPARRDRHRRGPGRGDGVRVADPPAGADRPGAALRNDRRGVRAGHGVDGVRGAARLRRGAGPGRRGPGQPGTATSHCVKPRLTGATSAPTRPPRG